MMVRVAGYSILILVVLIIGLVLAAQAIRPADLHDFESADFYRTSAAQTNPGDTGLLLGLSFDNYLGDDLADDSDLDVHVYPNFLPQIRRYAWYPYRDSDRLIVKPSWDSAVASITVDGENTALTDTIELNAQNHGQEIIVTAQNADGSRRAEYVILIMPHTFPPLKTEISSVDDVAPGIITGMQAAPNNPTFSNLKVLHILLYNNGFRATREALKKARQQTFDDFLAVDLGESLDLQHRTYLPFVNFVLDQYGTPLKYNNSAPRTIYLPFTTSKDEGLLPEQGFIYKEMVMDSADNFAEAITRSFIQRKGQSTSAEIPRHIDQFDDGHHIDVTPWETVQNLFYRIHPAGTELKNGDTLDKDVTSTYVVELDRQGNVVFEWDSVDHFPPDQAITYLPKDRYNEWDYFHSNGIRFTPGDEEILVSARHMRAVVNVDYPSGDINWVLADPATPLNQFTYIGDPLGGISTIHAAIMRGNELLVFDNGHYETPEYREGTLIYGAPIQTRHDYTRVVAYKIDTDAMTATYLREWTYPERLVRTAGYLMFVPRADGGENLLISWGSGGAFTEYSPDNQQTMSTDTGGLTYRFYKTNIDHWME
ncbi:MAG: aryl-sulfate sulfotransferase [Pseudomonadota bacterium]